MSAASIAAILTAAVVVLSGLAAVARALWRAATDLRDHKRATDANTVAIRELSTKMDGRITSLEDRVAKLEHP